MAPIREVGPRRAPQNLQRTTALQDDVASRGVPHDTTWQGYGRLASDKARQAMDQSTPLEKKRKCSAMRAPCLGVGPTGDHYGPFHPAKSHNPLQVLC